MNRRALLLGLIAAPLAPKIWPTVVGAAPIPQSALIPTSEGGVYWMSYNGTLWHYATSGELYDITPKWIADEDRP